MTTSRRRRGVIGGVLGLALVAAACASDAQAVTGADGGAIEGSLANCPNPIVIQTDWFPQPEQGALYELTAGQGTIDPASGRFTGPLAADPSIEVEIRAGGPFVEGRPTVAVMATDTDIFLGYVSTDEAIANYRELPTTAVVAPLDIDPRIVMWDPVTYDIETWDDLEDTGALINYSADTYYMEYLVGVGLVDDRQLDNSYTGAAGRFIGENGALIQEGFATQEPYRYEFVFEEWGRPVDWLLVHDAGYELYPGPLAILDARLDDAARSCLVDFVPIVQQAIVDFQQDPITTNAVIVQAVDDLDASWELSEDSVTDTVVQMGQLSIVSNGQDQTIGNFDVDRVTEVIQIIDEQVSSIVVPEGLRAEDLVTNEFIDRGIGL